MLLSLAASIQDIKIFIYTGLNGGVVPVQNQ